MRPPRLRSALLLASLASVALAGCLGSGELPAGGTSNSTLSSGETAVNATGDAGPAPGMEAEPGALVTRVLHLNADRTLTDAPPAAGSLAMGGSYAKCFVQDACDYLSFESTPLPHDVLLPPQTVTVRYFVEATAPVAPGPFGFGAWFGSTVTMPLFAMGDQSAPLLPGAPVQVEIPLVIENAPVVLPAGSSLRLYAISGGVHEGTGVLKLLTGGETPSSVTFSYRNVTLPAPAAAQAESVTGALTAPNFLVGDAVPDEHHRATHAFRLGANLTRLQVDLRMTSSAKANGGDMDLDVFLGDVHLGGGHTPLAAETVFLAGPVLETLRGAEITVVVSNFFAPKAEYEVTVTQS